MVLLIISNLDLSQNVVTRSTMETKYRAMILTTCELILLKQLLKNLQFGDIIKRIIICDNHTIFHISFNLIFYETIKHVMIDCYFIHEKIRSKDMKTEFVNSNDQLVDIFTWSLPDL